MVTVVATIFVLGVLIFIHELGHFTVAKWLGIRVERFSLGFPPKMVGKKFGDTEYLISWIPLGGYVRMAGDNPQEPLTGAPWEFLSRPRWQRMLVIIAGPALNYIFAFLLAWMIITFGGIATVDSVIEGVRESSLAERLGLAPEDRVVSLGEKSISTWDEIFDGMLRERGDTVSAQVQRAGSIHELVFDLTDVSREEILDLGISPLFTTKVGDVEKGGPAFRAGIRSGDVIEAIDGQEVSCSLAKGRPDLRSLVEDQGRQGAGRAREHQAHGIHRHHLSDRVQEDRYFPLGCGELSMDFGGY
jgi:regulator of sigma E protease